jgi:hypothetical protein
MTLDMALWLTGWASLLVAVAAGGVLAMRSRASNALDRGTLFLLPALTVGWLWIHAEVWLDMPMRVWNNARLAPSFALSQGLSIYHGADEGPMLSVIYTPLASLFFLPATLAPTPNAAILTASALGAAACLLAALAVHLRRGGSSRLHNILCFTLFAYVAGSETLVADALYVVHGDGLGFAFCVLTCLFVMARAGARVKLCLAAAALCAALAIWTKQTFVAVVPAIALHLWLSGRRRDAALFAVGTVVLTAFVGAVLAVCIDLHNVVFNTITIPGSQPWAMHHSLHEVLGRALKDIVHLAFWPMVLGTAGLTIAYRLGRQGRLSGARDWALDTTVFFILGVVMLPAAILGRIKFGGAANNYSLTTAPIACGLTLLLARLPDIAPAAASGARQVSLVVGAMLVAFNVDMSAGARLNATLLPIAPSQAAFQFARANPGTAYFPWHPLSSFMAEERLYSFAYAICDRELSGFTPSQAHVRAPFPATLRYIAFTGLEFTDTLKYFPEFTKVVKVDELPGWTVYTRP